MALSTKTKFNFVLEGASLLTLMTLIASGLIMEFRLPPGTGGQGAAAHGKISERALELAGLGRHDWGKLHFYIAMLFLALLVIHLALHWRWIWSVVRGPIATPHRGRAVLFLAATALFLMMATVPWLLPITPAKDQTSLIELALSPAVGQARVPVASHDESAADWLRGSSTVADAARATGLSIEEIGRRIGGVHDLRGNERLGPLARRAGLDMSSLRERLASAPGDSQSRP